MPVILTQWATGKPFKHTYESFLFSIVMPSGSLISFTIVKNNSSLILSYPRQLKESVLL